MIDRYLNEELSERLSERQRELIDRLSVETLKNEVTSEDFAEHLKDIAEQQSQIKDSEDMIAGYSKRGISASVSINKKKTPKQQPKDAWKKKKAKRRQQKQSRRKRH